jgi:hypothetical protein
LVWTSRTRSPSLRELRSDRGGLSGVPRGHHWRAIIGETDETLVKGGIPKGGEEQAVVNRERTPRGSGPQSARFSFGAASPQFAWTAASAPRPASNPYISRLEERWNQPRQRSELASALACCCRRKKPHLMSSIPRQHDRQQMHWRQRAVTVTVSGRRHENGENVAAFREAVVEMVQAAPK